MTYFRSISDVGTDLMQRISSGDFPLWNDTEEPGTAGSDALNPQSGPRDMGLGGDMSRSGIGKWADAETPARVNREVVKLRSEADWLAISESLYGMYRCMGRETAARAPRAARPIHLCIVAGHARSLSVAR